MVSDAILAVHLGGLGDVCLSESTFLSLVRHFGPRVTAVGNERFLGLFREYFSSVCSIEGRQWLYLFSDHANGPKWRRIVLIGKDRSGGFRDRLGRYSQEKLLFVDMYPDSGGLHVTDHQLGQLAACGIEPVRTPVRPRPGKGLIVYPEKGFRKRKWPYGNFLEVYRRLKDEAHPVCLLEPFDAESPHPESFRFDELSRVRSFISSEGVFISNDCGIAHLAASCGLTTVTLFSDADPAVWHPVGDNHSLRCAPGSPSIEEVLEVIRSVGGRS